MHQTGYYATGYYAAGYYGRAALVAVLGYTWFSLIYEARQVLEDTGGECPIRYTDDAMINALNRGLHELSRIRPDAYYDFFTANNLNVPEITEGPPAVDQTFWSDTYTLSLNFYPALVYYVVGQMQLMEDEYSQGANFNPNSSRAAGSLRLFRKHVLSV